MKILIVVKAYPAASRKYNETVCTAGITEEGNWIRIYPIPYRLVDYEKQFRKYEWIDLKLVKNNSDFRPESFRPVNLYLDDMSSFGVIPADKSAWAERRKYVQKNVYTNLSKLINEAKNPKIIRSLAVFKPTKILDFTYKKISEQWNPKVIDHLFNKKMQLNLFDTEEQSDIENFELVRKLPYKFTFRFTDDVGTEANLMIEDWETGMLYWNCLAKYSGNEELACMDVKKKYFDDFAKTKDYHFILGTTKKNHYVSKNPFVIIGDFRPKYIEQDSMF